MCVCVCVFPFIFFKFILFFSAGFLDPKLVVWFLLIFCRPRADDPVTNHRFRRYPSSRVAIRRTLIDTNTVTEGQKIDLEIINQSLGKINTERTAFIGKNYPPVRARSLRSIFAKKERTKKAPVQF